MGMLHPKSGAKVSCCSPSPWGRSETSPGLSSPPRDQRALIQRCSGWAEREPCLVTNTSLLLQGLLHQLRGRGPHADRAATACLVAQQLPLQQRILSHDVPFHCLHLRGLARVSLRPPEGLVCGESTSVLQAFTMTKKEELPRLRSRASHVCSGCGAQVIPAALCH